MYRALSRLPSTRKIKHLVKDNPYYPYYHYSILSDRIRIGPRSAQCQAVSKLCISHADLLWFPTSPEAENQTYIGAVSKFPPAHRERPGHG